MADQINNSKEQYIASLPELQASKKWGISRRAMLLWLAGIASAEAIASGVT